MAFLNNLQWHVCVFQAGPSNKTRAWIRSLSWEKPSLPFLSPHTHPPNTQGDQTILHSTLWFLSLPLVSTASSSQVVSRGTCAIWKAEVVGHLVKDKTAATSTLSRIWAGFASGPQHAESGLFSGMSLLFFLSFLRETLGNYSFMKQCLFEPAFICTLHLISLFSLLSCSICKVSMRRINKRHDNRPLGRWWHPAQFWWPAQYRKMPWPAPGKDWGSYWCFICIAKLMLMHWWKG